MGNETNLKTRIFELLGESDTVLSGEKISLELGISRVSVWKHIQKMIKAGIPISSSPKGYRLQPDPDSLQPLQFGEWQELIHYFSETGSTMNEAAALARQDCPDFTVVLAERQNEGRGRLQRLWTSADGGLYFTVVVRPEISLNAAGLLNLAAAVDMAEVLKTGYQIAARLKWPNDILVEDKKICGLLSQMEIEGGQVAHVNIGIGLNVNNRPEIHEAGSVSMRSLLGRPVGRREVLISFLERFKQRLSHFNEAALIEQWKANNSTIGKQVKIATVKETIEGTAVDLDRHGGLILKQTGGTLVTAVHGDCFYN
jgi:BirA family biotin operon repressor/biotin-[acetyl-CoA-carboxylase] ligase